jgi:hypothetical protein
MSALPSPAPPPPGRLSGLFPIPLVGATAILLVLIVFTPILFVLGPPAAGTYETRAELLVDEVSGNVTTTFYVRAIDPTLRYAELEIGTAGGFHWDGSCPTRGFNWTGWVNQTDVLGSEVATTSYPVLVEVNATYTEGGSTADYAALVAFYSANGTLADAACWGTTLPSSPQALGSLPLVLLLQDWSPGYPP